MKLHEIELFSKDPEASRRFYHELLRLTVRVDQKELKVFDSGVKGLDLDVSGHNPGKTQISFLVLDLEETIRQLKERGAKIPEPFDSHLGMRGIRLEDPDGNIVVIHAPTETSPEWLMNQVKFAGNTR
ncbi:MAG: VOC family protein [Planctomycetes bacterium]|nr:VOC family protein [Planctomycetota bacterium]